MSRSVPAHPSLASLGGVSPEKWEGLAIGPRLKDGSHLVLAEPAGSPKQQRRQLAGLGVTRLTVKSRDVAAEPREVLRSLGVTEGAEHVLVMTRRDGRALSLLTQPARRPPG